MLYFLTRTRYDVLVSKKQTKNTTQGDTNMTNTEQKMINYLQAKMDKFKALEAKYGFEDREVQHLLDEMIACKEMVEAIIEQPVNLQQDGKVTLGF